MKSLPNTHPEAHQKFLQGEFSEQRSSMRGFSETAVDQTVTKRSISQQRPGVELLALT